MLLSNGLSVSPLKNGSLSRPDSMSLREIVQQVDAQEDLGAFLRANHSKVPPRTGELKYERHPVSVLGAARKTRRSQYSGTRRIIWRSDCPRRCAAISEPTGKSPTPSPWPSTTSEPRATGFIPRTTVTKPTKTTVGSRARMAPPHARDGGEQSATLFVEQSARAKLQFRQYAEQYDADSITAAI